MSDALRIWAVSDGRVGMRNQALGLAEAVARQVPAEVEEKRIAVTRPWRDLPRGLWGNPFARLSPEGDALAPPWPDVFIACGRLTIPYSLAMQRRSLTVQTQDPRVAPSRFGLVVPPHHDRVAGSMVFPIHGSPNRLSEPRLAEDAARLDAALPPLPRPLAAVLIGGDSKDYRLTDGAAAGIADTLHAASQSGMGFLVTFSRRTPKKAEHALREALCGLPVWVWNGEPMEGLENPYLGMLGLADRFFVTEESTNMITEAAFTGRPVHLLRLQGGGAKWRRFHEALELRGVLDPLAALDAEWRYEPLRDTDRAAEAVIEAVEARRLRQVAMRETRG